MAARPACDRHGLAEETWGRDPLTQCLAVVAVAAAPTGRYQTAWPLPTCQQIVQTQVLTPFPPVGPTSAAVSSLLGDDPMVVAARAVARPAPLNRQEDTALNTILVHQPVNLFLTHRRRGVLGTSG